MHYTKTFRKEKKRNNVSTPLFGKKIPTQSEIKKQTFKKILIVKSQGFGNVINISPLIIKVHQMYPESKIDLLVRRSCKGIYEGWPIINKIFDLAELQYNKEKENYDIIIDGVPDGISLGQIFKNTKKIIKGNNIDVRSMHEVEANMKILKKIGWKKDFIPNTYIPIKKDTKEKIKNSFNFKYITICAGFADSPIWSKTKNWGYENYAKLINLLRKEERFKDYKFAILGIKKDNKILRYLKDKTNIINCVDIYSIRVHRL